MEFSLTKGQASCLVLGYKQTRQNHDKAKKLFADSPLTVAYKQGQDPMEPMAIGRIHVDLHPFKYRQYPPTASSSLVLMPSASSACTEASYIDNETKENMSSNESQGRKYFSHCECIPFDHF
jgi:hypothetical protein